jgi:hypothetical protein
VIASGMPANGAVVAAGLTKLQEFYVRGAVAGRVLVDRPIVRDHLIGKGLIYPCHSPAAQLTTFGHEVRGILLATAPNTATAPAEPAGEVKPEQGSVSPVGVSDSESPLTQVKFVPPNGWRTIWVHPFRSCGAGVFLNWCHWGIGFEAYPRGMFGRSWFYTAFIGPLSLAAGSTQAVGQ